MSDSQTTTTPAAELREAASRLRGTANGTTPGPWRRHDTHLNVGDHTATVLTARDEINDTELVAWLPSFSHEPWADHPCWANSHWIALVHPGLAEPLAALLDDVAGEAERHAAHGMGNSQDEVADGLILNVARALNGTSA